MSTVHRLSRQDARRLAVRAQALTRRRPSDLTDVVGRLGLLQLDPVSAIAPSADLVVWSRVGSRYDPAELRAAVTERRVIELRAMLRPAGDLVLHRAEMARWPGPEPLREWQVAVRGWVEANDACRRDLLARLEADGPLPSRDLPDTCVRPWCSTGWTNNKNVIRLLDFMAARGEVAVAGRRGRDRLWDLASRVYPDVAVPPPEEGERRLDARRLGALGVARPRGPDCPAESVDVGTAGEPATVEGTSGEWRIETALLDEPFSGRVALLSPFDRLVHDRVRMRELFGFDYHLEMYKPAAKRVWGYYALPILHGDRLVGKLDARADRKAGVLRVHRVHEDVPFTPAVRAPVDAEIDDLARWLGLERVDDDGVGAGR